jgi:hydroxyethylthiazole kinase-like sugar kinase family protein
MGKTFEQVNNTTIKVLCDMMDAAMKGYCEEIIRIKSYMIESQSSGKAASWTAKDLGNVADNIKSACSFVGDMTTAMDVVASGAKDIQVDGDQIAIDGYKVNGVSSDTT